MKSPEYVGLTTRVYKEALLQYQATGTCDVDETKIKALAVSFNRDFTQGYVLGAKDYDVIHGKSVNHQGIRIGKVIDRSYQWASIELSEPLSIGDGIRIKDDEQEMGFLVNEFYSNRQLVKQAPANSTIEIEVKQPVSVGALVYKTVDSQLKQQVAKTYDKEYRKIELQLYFQAVVGQAFFVQVSDGGHTITHRSSYIVQEANNAPVSSEMI